MNGVSGLSSGDVLLGGAVNAGWYLVVDADEGPRRVVAGPFPDRTEAGWAMGASQPGAVRPLYGVRRTDGAFTRRPSPEDWAWLAHLGGQLDRLPEDWDAALSDDDPLGTLVVEVTAALAEAGLPLHDPDGPGGGACLLPEPTLDGILVTWRQHDRSSVDGVNGATDGSVQQVMSRAVAELLALRGFAVNPFGGGSGHVVRRAA